MEFKEKIWLIWIILKVFIIKIMAKDKKV
jgi:hypothetical protein